MIRTPQKDKAGLHKACFLWKARQAPTLEWITSIGNLTPSLSFPWSRFVHSHPTRRVSFSSRRTYPTHKPPVLKKAWTEEATAKKPCLSAPGAQGSQTELHRFEEGHRGQWRWWEGCRADIRGTESRAMEPQCLEHSPALLHITELPAFSCQARPMEHRSRDGAVPHSDELCQGNKALY